MRFGSAAAALVLLAIACAGKSSFEGRDQGSDESNGGSVTGGSPTGGSTAGGGPAEGGTSSGAGGVNTGGTSGMACVTPEFREVCLSSCFVEEGGIFDRICVDGQWTCPEGTTYWNDCPPESCAGPISDCCAETGMATYRECAADGWKEACAPGERAIRRGDICAPLGLNVETCSALDRQPCDAGTFCFQGNTTCFCQVDDRWECIEPV